MNELRGQCLDCGDEWPDEGEVVVCPACGSLNVKAVDR